MYQIKIGRGHEDLRYIAEHAFLKNHMKELVSVDFFVVPTVTFRVLFCSRRETATQMSCIESSRAIRHQGRPL